MTLDPLALRETLAYIEAHPKEWHQRTWATQTACGTAYCFAGTACHLAGIDDFKWETGFRGRGAEAYYLSDDSPIEEVAQMVLGLTLEQRFELFFGFNTLKDLRYHVERICREAETA